MAAPVPGNSMPHNRSSGNVNSKRGRGKSSLGLALGFQGAENRAWRGLCGNKVSPGTLELLLESAAPPALELTPLPAPSSRREQVCQVPPELPQVLLLVPGKIHQVPQQERLHHGESRPKPTPWKGWGCHGGSSGISLGCRGNLELCRVFLLFGWKTLTSAISHWLWGGPSAGGGVHLRVSDAVWMRKLFQGGICSLPWAVHSVQPRFSLLCPVFPAQIAIYGTNFCTSARNAFFLLMRNIIR